LVKNETIAKMMNMIKHHLAITAAKPLMKPKPRIPAMIAIIKNTTA